MNKKSLQLDYRQGHLKRGQFKRRMMRLAKALPEKSRQAFIAAMHLFLRKFKAQHEQALRRRDGK